MINGFSVPRGVSTCGEEAMVACRRGRGLSEPPWRVGEIREGARRRSSGLLEPSLLKKKVEKVDLSTRFIEAFDGMLNHGDLAAFNLFLMLRTAILSR